jgi:hypothetical protein
VDFVVVGLGLGTLAILAGVLLLGWMAGRWERSAARATTPEDAAHDRAMAAGRRGAGQAFVGAGVAVLIATIGALAGSLDDQTGAFFVTTTATVAALGLLVWAHLFRTRNPLPPRRRVRTVAETEDGSRRTEDGRRAEAPGASGPATEEMLPLEDEPTVGAAVAEENVRSGAQIVTADRDHVPALDTVKADDGNEAADEAPEQLHEAMNGAEDAPAVDEDEDNWEGRRD